MALNTFKCNYVAPLHFGYTQLFVVGDEPVWMVIVKISATRRQLLVCVFTQIGFGCSHRFLTAGFLLVSSAWLQMAAMKVC